MADSSIITELDKGTSLIQQFNSFFDFFDGIDKDLMFQVIISFVTVMYIWETYLSYRQVKGSAPPMETNTSIIIII